MSVGRGYSDARIARLGAISLVVMALVLVSSFNLSKFPGLAGGTYRTEFSDASGLHRGNMVQVAGIRVGRVQDVALKDSNTVVVTFDVDNAVDLGDQTRASIAVLNLLGEKYLDVQPAGTGRLSGDDVIPRERTESAYDIVGVFSDLTDTTENIDTQRLSRALDIVGDTTNHAAPEIQQSFRGIARLSQSVASRDAQVQALLQSSQHVTRLLADRSGDLVDLMHHSDLVFREVRRRKEAVHLLLVNARDLAVQLRGVAQDNRAQMGPALREVDNLLALLNSKQRELKATLAALGPYVSILSNIIGTGPWFDAYAANLLAIPTGEFQPTKGGP